MVVVGDDGLTRKAKPEEATIDLMYVFLLFFYGYKPQFAMKLVHLLIDSNVAHNPDGSFGHTCCFILDDTGRKIRGARKKILPKENERVRNILQCATFTCIFLSYISSLFHII